MTTIYERANTALLRAGAIFQCHGMTVAANRASAVKRAVLLNRLNPFDGCDADETELALLEAYLHAPEFCPFCTARLKSKKRRKAVATSTRVVTRP